MFNGAILQQAFVVEFVVEDHMCPDCTRRAVNPNQWVACAQVIALLKCTLFCVSTTCVLCARFVALQFTPELHAGSAFNVLAPLQCRCPSDKQRENPPGAITTSVMRLGCLDHPPPAWSSLFRSRACAAIRGVWEGFAGPARKWRLARVSPASTRSDAARSRRHLTPPQPDPRARTQVRQHTHHKRTFMFLEQLILKHGVDESCSNVRNIHEGVDFFFANRQHAIKFIDFLQNVVPIRYAVLTCGRC